MNEFEPKILDSVDNVPHNLFVDYYNDDGNEIWQVLFDKYPDCYEDVSFLWQYLIDEGTRVHLYFKESEDETELYTGLVFESEQDFLAFKLKWL